MGHTPPFEVVSVPLIVGLYGQGLGSISDPADGAPALTQPDPVSAMVVGLAPVWIGCGSQDGARHLERRLASMSFRSRWLRTYWLEAWAMGCQSHGW